jgi:microcystin-dependent protein
MCNGQLLPINQNQALFSILGTTYGGNGQTTFALPDLRGRVPIGTGTAILGQKGGQEAHTVTMSEMPAHIHFATGNSPGAANQFSPATAVWGVQTATPPYSDQPANTTLHPGTISNIGGSQPHTNMQPYSVLNICIALQGIFPSRN